MPHTITPDTITPDDHAFLRAIDDADWVEPVSFTYSSPRFVLMQGRSRHPIDLLHRLRDLALLHLEEGADGLVAYVTEHGRRQIGSSYRGRPQRFTTKPKGATLSPTQARLLSLVSTRAVTHRPVLLPYLRAYGDRFEVSTLDYLAHLKLVSIVPGEGSISMTPAGWQALDR